MSPAATVVKKGGPVARPLRSRDITLDLKRNRIWINHPEQGLLMVYASPRVCGFLFLLVFWRPEKNHGLMPTDFDLAGDRGTAKQVRRELARSFESAKLPRKWAGLVVQLRRGKPKGYRPSPGAVLQEDSLAAASINADDLSGQQLAAQNVAIPLTLAARLRTVSILSSRGSPGGWRERGATSTSSGTSPTAPASSPVPKWVAGRAP